MITTEQNIITRRLPKTQQTIMFFAGDDGDREFGWWRNRLNANNRFRWITQTVAGEDIVIDRATGLMWAADGNAKGCNFGATLNWPNAVAYCAGLRFFTKRDWRLPNAKELQSIINHSIAVGAMISEPPFSNTVVGRYWASTTRASLVTQAFFGRFDWGPVWNTALKTTLYYVRAVRKMI